MSRHLIKIYRKICSYHLFLAYTDLFYTFLAKQESIIEGWAMVNRNSMET